MAELHVELVSVEREVWSGEADSVIARTTEGEVGILPGHTPLLAVLRRGEVRVMPVSGEIVRTEVEAGFLSVDGDRVTVVSDTAIADARPAGR